MGIFNNMNEKTKTRNRERNPTLFLTCRTENTDSGLFQWVFNYPNIGFQINDSTITVKQDCTLIILVDGIKTEKGEVLMKVRQNNTIKQSYIARNNRKNEMISINYAGKFKLNDIITVESLNVKNIQVTIYGE